MAANLELGRADLDALAAAVREQDVDVLVLLELTPEAADALAAAGLDDLLPEQELRPGARTGRLRCAEPVPAASERHVPPSRFAQPAVEVGTDQGPVLVRAAHPTPPVRFPVLWHEELGDLAGWASGEHDQDTPVVLAGDLNSSQDHPAFRRLTAVHDRRPRGARSGLGAAPGRRAARCHRSSSSTTCSSTACRWSTPARSRLPRTDHAAVWARFGAPGG